VLSAGQLKKLIDPGWSKLSGTPSLRWPFSTSGLPAPPKPARKSASGWRPS